MAESWLVRQGDPLFAAEPEGAWAVGIKVTDDEVWARVEQDVLTGLSASRGRARRYWYYHTQVNRCADRKSTSYRVRADEANAAFAAHLAAVQIAPEVARLFGSVLAESLEAHNAQARREAVRLRRRCEEMKASCSGRTRRTWRRALRRTGTSG